VLVIRLFISTSSTLLRLRPLGHFILNVPCHHNLSISKTDSPPSVQTCWTCHILFLGQRYYQLLGHCFWTWRAISILSFPSSTQLASSPAISAPELFLYSSLSSLPHPCLPKDCMNFPSHSLSSRLSLSISFSASSDLLKTQI
jgi:hypothetical protein